MLIGKGVFHLIPVEELFLCAEDGKNIQVRESADAFERIDHLPLLGVQLLVVRKMLPLAAATDARVLATRLNAEGRRAFNAKDARFGKLFFRPVDFGEHEVAGNSVLDEDDEVPEPGDGFPFNRGVDDFKLNFVASRRRSR